MVFLNLVEDERREFRIIIEGIGVGLVMGIFRIDKFELFFSIYFLWKRIAESGIKVDLDVTEIKEIEGIDNNGREDRVSFKRVSEF